jgi:hypothetical protein
LQGGRGGNQPCPAYIASEIRERKKWEVGDEVWEEKRYGKVTLFSFFFYCPFQPSVRFFLPQWAEGGAPRSQGVIFLNATFLWIVGEQRQFTCIIKKKNDVTSNLALFILHARFITHFTSSFPFFSSPLLPLLCLITLCTHRQTTHSYLSKLVNSSHITLLSFTSNYSPSLTTDKHLHYKRTQTCPCPRHNTKAKNRRTTCVCSWFRTVCLSLSPRIPQEPISTRCRPEDSSLLCPVSSA